MSIAQTWFGRSIATFREQSTDRSGGAACRLLVFGRRYSASMPIFAHQRADVLAPDREPSRGAGRAASGCRRTDAPGAVRRCVASAPGPLPRSARLVVDRRARQIQQLRLARRSAARASGRSSLCARIADATERAGQKIILQASWPILACSVLTSVRRRASRRRWRRPRQRARSSSGFHWAIWFGWTSYRSASSATCWSARQRPRATFALKAGEWLRRGRFMLSAPSGTVGPLLQRLHLSGCPKYPAPLLRTVHGRDSPAAGGSSMTATAAKPTVTWESSGVPEHSSASGRRKQSVVPCRHSPRIPRRCILVCMVFTNQVRTCPHAGVGGGSVTTTALDSRFGCRKCSRSPNSRLRQGRTGSELPSLFGQS